MMPLSDTVPNNGEIRKNSDNHTEKRSSVDITELRCFHHQQPPQMPFRSLHSDWNQLLQHIDHSLLSFEAKVIISDMCSAFNAKIMETKEDDT